MSNPTPVISTLAPLGASDDFVSATQYAQRATSISGTVFADQPGMLMIEQSGDGTNFDYTTEYNIPGSFGYGFDVDLVASYWRIVYLNDSTPQTIFRLYANPRDPYGEFLQPAATPSPGGAYVVLQSTPNGGYTYVGRFDGNSGWDACSAAAVSLNSSGKYAAFLVDQATVASENVMLSADPSPSAF